MKPQNIKATKELIERYNSITLKEIKANVAKSSWNTPNMGRLVAKQLTGFSNKDTCPLCIAINDHCYKCIHILGSYGDPDRHHCWNHDSKSHVTYRRIERANSPIKLRNAFRARAKYLQSLIDLT